MKADRRTDGILVLDDVLSAEQLELLANAAAHAEFASQRLG